MVEMNAKAKEAMHQIPLPEYFQQARKLGLDLKGQSNREKMAVALMDKVATMPQKDALKALDPRFRDLAQASGALNLNKVEPDEAPAEEAETVQTATDDTKKNNKAGKAQKALKSNKPGGGSKTSSKDTKDAKPAANSSVPAKKQGTSDISFPKEKLDKIVESSLKNAHTEADTVAKVTFQFFGKHYSQIQQIFAELKQQVAIAQEKGEKVPNVPTMEEYMEDVKFYDKVDRSPQRLRKDALVYNACQVDGKIPDDVMTRLTAVGTAKAEAVSSLPKIRDAIMKGILVDTKITPLEKLNKKQVIDAVRLLTGKDTNKSPAASRSQKKLIDIPKEVDRIAVYVPKWKSSKPTTEMLKDPQFEKRLRSSLETINKLKGVIENTLDLFGKK